MVFNVSTDIRFDRPPSSKVISYITISWQGDIERLCKWSNDWLLGFNIKKCKVVSYGNVKFEYEYRMTDSQKNLHVLSTEDSGSDLCISFQKT